MKVNSLGHVLKLARERGLGYVFEQSSQQVITYLRDIFFWPVYFGTLKSLPSQMTRDQVVEFVEHGCSGVFRPLQMKSELRALVQCVQRRQPKVLLEIGTANGGTLLAMSRVSHPNAKVVSIDLPSGSFGGGYAWYKAPLFHAFVSAGQQLSLLRVDSHAQTTRQKLESILDGHKIEFLMIDGDHTYEGVKRDFELYAPLVKKGGVIAFHDIVKHQKEMNCQVDRLWNELKKKYWHQEFIEDVNQGFCGIGLIRV